MGNSFIPVEDIHEPLSISLGLSGGSGTGKTFSALLIARGMARAVAGPDARIGIVDTENRRALHYKEAFPEMVHLDLKAVDEKGNMLGFGPERWIEILDLAEEQKLPALVIDSFSHAWEGVGGVLDLHAEKLDELTGGNEEKRSQRSQLAWAHVKPRYRRLIDRIVRANTNIIICTRAKPVMQTYQNGRPVNARKTKTRRADVPWDVAADGDLMFEMTAMVILDPSAPGCPIHQIKVADQFKTLFDPRKPMGEDLGRQMVEWAQGDGDAAGEKEAMDAARAAARTGRQGLQAFWSKAKEHMPENRRRAVWNIMETELKGLAAAADTKPDEMRDDLYDDPPGDDAPGEDQAGEEGEAEVNELDALRADIARALEFGQGREAIEKHFEGRIKAVRDQYGQDALEGAFGAEAA